MKRILFNATHAEELRVAIVDGQKLLDLDLESAQKQQRKGNIYKGVVTRVEPSLEAAFVSYGPSRQGFLPFKEIYKGYFKNFDNDKAMSDVNIKDVIKEGQELIVQVEKDERGNKGAALTTFISLAGRFIVLMPNNPKGGGISRRVAGQQRADLKQAMSTLELSSKHALIARTAALGRGSDELAWDLDFLKKLWSAIEQAAKASSGPTLIYQETNLVVRAIRDHMNTSVQEVIVDDQEIYERAHRFISQVMPQNLNKLKLHEGNTSLFARFQIEQQIESAFSRDVQLPSGGSIVIDHTEALVAVDVNSAKATKGSDIEETALQTNLEAVEEIARQLRLRDMGGLVVLDLIDMSANQNQRAVENKLKEALSVDRARVQVGRISRFGLLEMSRQRLRSSIGDSNYHNCPRCEGTGKIRSIVSSSLNLLRLVEDEALKENTEQVQVFLPVESSAYILNEKRSELIQLEKRVGTRVLIIPTTELEFPHYQINRVRSNEEVEELDEPSFKLKPEVDKKEGYEGMPVNTVKQVKPMIGVDDITHGSPPPITPSQNKPSANPSKNAQRNPRNNSRVDLKPAHTTEVATASTATSETGLLKRLWGSLTGTPAETAQPEAKTETNENKPNTQETTRTNNRGRGGNRRGGQNRNRTQNRQAQNQPNRRNKPKQEAHKTQDSTDGKTVTNEASSAPNSGQSTEQNSEQKTSNARRRPPRRKPTGNRRPAQQGESKQNNDQANDGAKKEATNTNSDASKPAEQKTEGQAPRRRNSRGNRRGPYRRGPRQNNANNGDKGNQKSNNDGNKNESGNATAKPAANNSDD